MEWYEITKSNFAECEPAKQERLMRFFKEQLSDYISQVEQALMRLESQQYILCINELYDNDLKKIIGDYRYIFKAARYSLEGNANHGEFWERYDAVHGDLAYYINKWKDIRYYNFCRFVPSSLFDDEDEILRAINESKKTII